ncbi:hypothetical protein [Halomonas salina]|uniref:hypothetical protein n=1 Tax=Halomonas salina TaxID=42565 RepID=UPI001268B694|nr:hypothetical protein [Halomonas salina]
MVVIIGVLRFCCQIFYVDGAFDNVVTSVFLIVISIISLACALFAGAGAFVGLARLSNQDMLSKP